MIRQLTALNHALWKTYLKKGMTAVDATLGQGHDALMFAQMVGEEGHVCGFDVQEAAIVASEALLKPYKQVVLIHGSHEDIDCYFLEETVDAVVYNLGFLPGGDKAVTTQVDSTLVSIKKALICLKIGGVMSVSLYPGHEAGYYEAQGVEAYLTALDSKGFHVMRQSYINQAARAPYTLWVEKKRSNA